MTAASDLAAREAAERDVRQAFERYEQALRAHDVDALNAFFLDGADTVRYGVAEQHYGHADISAHRRDSTPVHPQRRILRAVITAHDAAVVSVSAEFIEPSNGALGRQTQTWVRTGRGWRIAVAHVSLSMAARP